MQGPRSLLLVAGCLLAAFGGACTKPDSSPVPVASASVAPAATPAPSMTASAAPSATTAESAAAATPAPTAEGTRKDSGPAAPSGSTAAAPECGKKPLPDCPLQAWMKSNTNPPVMTNDLPKLAVALDKIVAFAPPGYTNWSSIAKDGAAAAKGGDMTAAKASCRTCHDQYKEKYKTEIRARKI